MIRIGNGEYIGGRLAERGLEIAIIIANATGNGKWATSRNYDGLRFDTGGDIYATFSAQDWEDSIEIREEDFEWSDEQIRIHYTQIYTQRQLEKKAAEEEARQLAMDSERQRLEETIQRSQDRFLELGVRTL